jgi:DtxR family transcriptional regulator, Mn-dependent transcriptional regulator
VEFGDAIQDYAKAIYKLETETGRAATNALAARLGVAPASVTGMLKRLSALGLVTYEPYRGATLTESGTKLALEVIRHHRLVERYLVDTLGLPLDLVHAEAERLEHALSEDLEAVIDRSLGFPTYDPHGDPIPDAELRVTHPELKRLDELAPGQSATVRRVPDADADVLHYLTELRLVPGEQIRVRQAAPFDGPLTVEVGGSAHPIARELASLIGVD